MDHDDETAFLDWIGALVGSSPSASRRGGPVVGSPVVGSPVDGSPVDGCSLEPGSLEVGPGDDCAVIICGSERLLLKVDSVLEGTHFQRADADAPGYATVAEAGHKAMLRTVSDIAAMGGLPRFSLLSLGLPEALTAPERQALLEALQESAALHDVAIVGGDTKSWSSDRLSISVTLIGVMDGLQPVLRSGGQVGDTLYVTGTLGGSISGKHKAPQPRIAAGRWLAAHGATAMMDLSDGLSLDLWRLCRASGCSAQIDTVPVSRAATQLAQSSGHTAIEHALHDGEDYELLVALPTGDAATPSGAAASAGVHLHPIGRLIADSDADGPAAIWLADPTRDRRQRLDVSGYQHRWRK